MLAVAQPANPLPLGPIASRCRLSHLPVACRCSLWGGVVSVALRAVIVALKRQQGV